MALPVMVTLCAAADDVSAQIDPAGQIIGRLLADNAPAGAGAAAAGEREVLRRIYASRSNSPLWVPGARLSNAARQLMQTLYAAPGYGLRREDYAADVLMRDANVMLENGNRDPGQRAAFDLALSAAALRFIAHLHSGRVKPQAADFHLPEPQQPPDLAPIINKLAATDDVAAAVAEVEPRFLHYRLLRQWLPRYRFLAADATLWALPPARRTLKTGDEYSTAALKRLLVALGDLPAADAARAADDRLDATLAAALARFQQRHGLEADGVLGKRTFVALTTPLTVRLRQIELTLERWRWLPPFESPPIIVNVPQFRLYALRSTQDRVNTMLQMPVIVGQTYPHTRTPIFVDDMKFVVFRPYWDIPRSILQRELLPQIQAKPGYLERNRLQIVQGESDDARPMEANAKNIEALAAGKLRLRQLPGPDNSLGLIKFMFPNDYNVYLHSTPAHELFEESRRAFSHGCIRVSDPVALAEHVLSGTPGWDRTKIEAAMNGDRNSQRVYLAQPLRVMVLYATALATEAGRINFFEDIYGHDHRLGTLIDQLRPPMSVADLRR